MSDEFSAALAGPVHTISTLVEVLDARGVAHVIDVDNAGGTVAVDATAQIRRRMENLSITDITLAPMTQDALLAPYENEVRISRGIEFPNGVREIYPLGVFGIEQVHITESRDGLTVTIEQGNDRSAAVSQNAWTQPYPIEPATNVGAAIRAIVEDRLPGATFNFALTDALTPGLILGTSSQNDPWKDAADLAQSIGYDLFFDPAGVCVLRPFPSDADAASFFYGDDQPNPLLSIDRVMTRENSYTQVVAVAESSTLGEPLRSVASIPSNRPRTFFYKTTLATSQEQLDAAAAALLRRYSGVYSTTSIVGIPDPRLDVNTVGLVSRAAVGIFEERMLLESFSVGLTPAETMPMTVRLP